MGYTNVTDIQEDIGKYLPELSKAISDLINDTVQRAQADAWEEGYKRGKSDKSDMNIDFLNPYL